MGELSDYIHYQDIKQNDPATARVCQKNPDHGRLTVHGSGGGLVCARYIKGEKAVVCDYVEPLSR